MVRVADEQGNVYVYNPKQDITLQELGWLLMVFQVIIPKQKAGSVYDMIPPSVTRHFDLID